MKHQRNGKGFTGVLSTVKKQLDAIIMKLGLTSKNVGLSKEEIVLCCKGELSIEEAADLF